MKSSKLPPCFKSTPESILMVIREWLTSLNFQLQTIFGRRMESRDTYWLGIIPGMILLMAAPGVLTFEIRKGIFDGYSAMLLLQSIIAFVPIMYFMYSCVNYSRK